ncbi:MAG: flavodoxin/nitric oxide synthase [Phenylobacterium sp.]|uniref:flavodoxin domain-containing protein n=1 Tax=Phenylobacterium sp. TaxID=1871053 RepID=UPI000DB2DD1B|nr:flavodoxin domain-containing protein [Phenylobacterium sp.]PZQ57753.1 MAG: flavodoxin/nitric oxide synthase [Phenylobacterium zucineum]TAJ74061.1 MAG: flavodoxin/nitric oxide synthase [Phenylobacterium sp.]
MACSTDPDGGDEAGAGDEALGELRFAVLAATQSGNALLVADMVAERLIRRGAKAAYVLDEGRYPGGDLADCDVLVACVASHGEGDVPDGFREVYQALIAGRPDLSHLRYGLVGLGDRTYATFCGGAWKVDALLQMLGARRIGEPCTIDASLQPFPDEEALAWLEAWLPELWRAPPQEMRASAGLTGRR